MICGGAKSALVDCEDEGRIPPSVSAWPSVKFTTNQIVSAFQENKIGLYIQFKSV